MKILTITDFLFPSYLGGSARFASDLNEALTLNGHSVISLSRRSHGVYAGGQDKTNRKVPKINLSMLFNCNYIFSHHPIFAIFPAIFFPKKFIYFYHGPFAEEFFLKTAKRGFSYNIRKYLEEFILYRSKKIIVVSQYMANKIHRHDQKILNLGPIQKLHSGTGNFEMCLKHEGNQYKCLTVRRLTARTGVSQLLNIVALSANINLMVVGSGELLGALVSRFSKVAQFYSKISDEKLKQLYEECDVVILPSIDLEGFGVIILEALAAGKPILASTTSGGAYDFLRKLGIKTFLDINLDDSEILEKKLNIIMNEFNNNDVKSIIRYELKNSFFTNYAKRLLNVL